jgi:hypothetical protein
VVAYRDQCLWQSIAVFRSDPEQQKARYKRCNAVYELAVRKDPSLATVINHYAYAATAFIK